MNTNYRAWRDDLDLQCQTEGFEHAHDVMRHTQYYAFKELFRLGFSPESSLLYALRVKYVSYLADTMH